MSYRDNRTVRYEDAINEAERFLVKAREAKDFLVDAKGGYYGSSKIVAAAKRASLDLTRALAELRKV